MGGILKFEAGKAGIVLFFIAILQVLFIPQANATHLRAGQIVATRVSCTGLTFRITVTVYTNTGSTVLFGGEMDYLDFGDGSAPILVPETPNNPDLSLGPDVASASFTIEHTYSGPGRYVISYVEPNRNGGVLNMANSISTTFYIETQINIDPFFGCNNTPQLLIPPIDRACTGVAFFHNPGAFDPDGDSLSYEFVIPFRNRNETVAQYRDPNDQSFYANFPNGNEAGNGPPTFTINPVDGTIIWDAPGLSGQYNIAFIVVEWRKINGQWFRLGFVRRDMQIIVDDCDNERPDLIVPEDICVEAGTTINATIFGIDPESHDVKIEAFSEIFNFESPATYSPVPGLNDYQPSNPPAELEFEWETQCFHVKELPYQVVFKITDNPPDANGNPGRGPKLVTFKTWRIRVVAPPPVWSSATPDFTNRSALLTWQDYTCSQEAAFIQVWRRVDSITFEPDSCQTGMPPFLGYTQVGQVAATATQFNDTGLDVGARYCYRLVAVYPQPGGGESYVSQEICIPPILADAPVITHVTIEKTSLTDGEIRVSWRAPFDADEGQFPKEPYGYDYVVERADGFAGTNYVAIHTGTLPGDTTILDTNLDTDSKIYNYRVKVFAQNQTTPFDQSASASTVRLELKPSSGRIELNWNAFVPWSNQIQSFPLHDIYRGPENATEGDLTLIASVNVFDSLFRYTDVGQHNNEPLDNNTVYCYRVMTRGGYGNPAIAVPQENYSQIICAQPVDDEAPCKPVLQAELTNCEDFVQQEVCNFNTFSNTIFWNRPEDETCRADIRTYNVYVANSVGAPFSLLATNVTDTFYVHNNLNTFARCYRISAVDRSGNESELSDPVCNDNCPYYELPNIFTPNGDGFNDLFSAFNVREYQNCGNGEEGCQVPAHLQGRCARFVQRVELTIINRWGGEVYNYTSGGENTIFVDWDGRDNGGKPLASGIYFYKADVTFDVVDPKKRVQTIKGWVHLVR
ncbi:MAG: gliding motility-associated C-terminal domain-containing protein [Cyclobacteriaceae bacterium]|nr:MAG: gliding motility-associated C-terminal domain-containing protein [Cyclobacteriaceae bacterium]